MLPERATGPISTINYGWDNLLSRSLFGSMTPKARTAEFFGFYDISSKFAGVLGPLLFSATALIFGTSRLGIISLVVFFVVGAFLLSRVDEQSGIALARAEDAHGTDVE